MARYNEILVGRFNRALQKLTAIKGAAPAPQLSSEIYPVHLMEHKPEYRVLESWNRFATVLTQGAGGAGNFSAFRLRNPAGSNVVCVVEKCGFPVVPANPFFVSLTTNQVDLTTIQTARRLDARSIGNNNTVGSTGLLVGVGAQALQLMNTGSAAAPDVEVILEENQEITLLAGDSLDIQCGTANTAATAWYWWRERFLEDSERTA